jgi:hypothetical protein
VHQFAAAGHMGRRQRLAWIAIAHIACPSRAAPRQTRVTPSMHAGWFS